ncbi:MAG: hypothetical protein NTW44_06935 [Nitrospirae bacterium]|nr:hypothetical protein [Nitrospirota bacterium]
MKEPASKERLSLVEKELAILVDRLDEEKVIKKALMTFKKR